MSLYRGQLLPSIPVLFLILFVTGPVFAEDSIIMETDKNQYSTNDAMIVSGIIPNWKMPVIAMSIFGPDGEILAANNVEIEDGTFTKIVFLDPPFYETPGTYLITVEYGKRSAITTFDIISSSPQTEEPVDEAEEIVPAITMLETDKESYSDDEFITIKGKVTTISEPTVLIGIHNPDGSPAGFYIAEIDSNLLFTTSFLAKSGVNFKTFGTYSVKAHYAETNFETVFDFIEISQPETEEPQSEPVPEPDTQAPQPEQSVPPIPQNSQEPTKTTEVKPEVVEKPQAPAANQNDQPEYEQQKEKAEQNIQETEPHDNLTVEDEELGKMLNEIMLNCDTSELKDSITYDDGMGPALMRLCKYNEAINYFDAALIKNPQSEEIYSNKGSALSKTGQFSTAITYYDQALQINPDFIPALNNKANALLQLGNYEEAILLYNQVLDLDPSYTTSQENLQKAMALYSKRAESEEVQMVQQREPNRSEPPLQMLELPPAEPTETEPEKTIFEHIGKMFSSIGSIFGIFS